MQDNYVGPGHSEGQPAGDSKLLARVEHSEKMISELRQQLLALSAVANSQALIPQAPAGADKELLARLEKAEEQAAGLEKAGKTEAEKLEQTQRSFAEKLARTEKDFAERLARAERLAADLRRELLTFTTAPVPAPVVMPVHPDKELLERILYAEKTAADLKQELELQRGQLRAYVEAAVTREELQKTDFKAADAVGAVQKVQAGLQDQASAFAVAKRGVESAMAELEALSRKVGAQAGLVAALGKECGDTLAEARLAQKAAAELKAAAAAEAESLRAEIASRAPKEEIDRVEQKAAEAVETARKAREESLAIVEAARAELNAASEKIKADIRAYEEEAVRNRVKAAESAQTQEEMLRRVSGYTLQFTDIEHSCKLALAEMEGHLREFARLSGGGKFAEQMGEAVSGLREKMSAVEKNVFAGLGELSGRLTADEVLFRKIFTEAEERIRKSMEPELEVFARKFTEQSQKLDWLTQEYDVITKRRLRALEAKSASYDALMERIREEETRKLAEMREKEGK